jgi:oxygen-independent coproporphyrinogen-3 oxidase
VPSTLPEGDPAPADGALPLSSYDGLGARPFGVYVHVPFCASRCGYCDFNTYTAAELGSGASIGSWQAAVLAEIRLARTVLAAQGGQPPPAATVFFGGGTPSLAGSEVLTRILTEIREVIGLEPGAEVTTEANPESVDPAMLGRLRSGGFTRISFGVQSTSERVLAELDRRHTPGRALAAIGEAQAAGFEHVSADLIYGSAAESDADWLASLEAVAASGVDHVSAYSLIVEPGTRLAARVRRGEVAAPDDDTSADRYLIAEQILTRAGFASYEVSNWARGEDARCRHNLGYWSGGDWWGVGPGAHSHVGGLRWWNVKHPAAYTARLGAQQSPAAGRELLDAEDRWVEDILLRLRLAEGLPADRLTEIGRKAADRAVAGGLLEPGAWQAGRAVLTVQGRLLADGVVRDLVD